MTILFWQIIFWGFFKLQVIHSHHALQCVYFIWNVSKCFWHLFNKEGVDKGKRAKRKLMNRE